MGFYRVKQFFRATLNNFKGISLEDNYIIRNYLDDELINIFYKMNRMDQNHCLNVCKDVIKEKNFLKNDIELINSMAVAALLHDVGKSNCKSSITYKIIFVLLKPFYNKGILDWKTATKYYEHSDISFSILKEYNLSETTLHLIKNHHNLHITDDNLLVFRKFDDKN